MKKLLIGLLFLTSCKMGIITKSNKINNLTKFSFGEKVRFVKGHFYQNCTDVYITGKDIELEIYTVKFTCEYNNVISYKATAVHVNELEKIKE